MSYPALRFALPQHNVEELVRVEIHPLIFLLHGAQSSGCEDSFVCEQATFFDSLHRPPAQPRVLTLDESAKALQSLDDDEGLFHSILLSFVTVGDKEHGCVEVGVLSLLVKTSRRAMLVTT